MTYKAFDAVEWKQGLIVKLKNGEVRVVIKRCTGPHADLVETAVPSCVSFRDIERIVGEQK